MANKWIIGVMVALGAGVLLLDSGMAIKCFNCNSAHQADCVDWFDNVTQHLVECFHWQTKCRKVVQEVWIDDHWDVRYVRQCAGDNSRVGLFDGRICQEKYGVNKVRMRYCHCDNQDGCNFAPVATSSGFIVTLLLTLLSFTAPKIILVPK